MKSSKCIYVALDFSYKVEVLLVLLGRLGDRAITSFFVGSRAITSMAAATGTISALDVGWSSKDTTSKFQKITSSN